MKKWLSLILSVVLLCSASLAMGENAPAWCAAVNDWAAKMDTEKNDYVTTVYQSGMPVSRSTLRSGNGITELKIEAPLTAEDGQELDYTETGLIQYSDQGLVIKIGDQTTVVDVQSILALLNRNQDFSPATIKSDAKQIASLAIKAGLTLLQPTVTHNAENGSLQIRVSVTDKELKERFPTFLESVSADEEVIDYLLMKYSEYICAVIPNMPLSLEGIKKSWQARMDNPAWTMPSITLEADAAVLLASEGKDFQIGLTGNLAVAGDQVNFSMEYLPGKDSFLLSGNVNGVAQEKPFDHDFFAQKQANQLDATLSLNGEGQTVFTLNASLLNNELNVSLGKEDSDHVKQVILLNGFYDEATRNLSGYLNYNCYSATDDPSIIPTNQDLLSLSATIQDQGILGTLTIGEQANLRFTLTNGGLYYRGQFFYSDYAGRTDMDAWIFPQGNNTYRYKFETKSFNGQAFSERYQVTGTVNPLHLDMTVAPVLGDPLLKLDATRTIEENGQSVTGTLEANFMGKQLKMQGDLNVDARKCPTFFDGEIDITGESIALPLPNGVYKISYLPGKLTFIDNQNFYELARTEDTAGSLAYVLTRNKIAELGSFAGKLSDAEGLSAAVTVGDGEVPTWQITVVPVPYAEPVREAEEPRVIVGIFEGSYNEEGQVKGTIVQPEAEEAPVLVETQKITPIDVAGAVKVNANTVLSWMLRGPAANPQNGLFPTVPAPLPEEAPLEEAPTT